MRRSPGSFCVMLFVILAAICAFAQDRPPAPEPGGFEPPDRGRDEPRDRPFQPRDPMPDLGAAAAMELSGDFLYLLSGTTIYRIDTKSMEVREKNDLAGKMAGDPKGPGGPPAIKMGEKSLFVHLNGVVFKIRKSDLEVEGSWRLPRSEPGPWDQDVLVYRAKPDETVEKVATFERAGVPTIARMKDGRLIAAHQHFPENSESDFDKVAVRFSSDEGKTWTKPKVIGLKGLPDGMRFPFDPTLVALPDGKVRLYFTSTRGRTFQTGTPAIYSAISDDGVNYTFEDGMRFGVEGRIVIDCAVVLHKGVFHLYSPDNGTASRQQGAAPREGIGYHATSKDGLKFTREDDVRIEGARRWLGNAMSDGKNITFCGTGEGYSADGKRRRGGLWMATSTDGKKWKLVPGPAVSGGDPGAVASPDGGLVVVITGEPRPGTPSANRRRERPPAPEGDR
jgi:hypothetical protein